MVGTPGCAVSDGLPSNAGHAVQFPTMEKFAGILVFRALTGFS